jgi:hypothetical protein
MEKITKEMIQDYSKYVEKIENIRETLFDKAEEVFTWENENLGKNHTACKDSIWRCTGIGVDNINVNFHIEESWSYGGYDSTTVSLQIYKLLGDEWRENALKQYKDKQEEQLKKKEKESEKKAKIKEQKERELYEQLKAKYENA